MRRWRWMQPISTRPSVLWCFNRCLGCDGQLTGQLIEIWCFYFFQMGIEVKPLNEWKRRFWVFFSPQGWVETSELFIERSISRAFCLWDSLSIQGTFLFECYKWNALRSMDAWGETSCNIPVEESPRPHFSCQASLELKVEGTDPVGALRISMGAPPVTDR